MIYLAASPDELSRLPHRSFPTAYAAYSVNNSRLQRRGNIFAAQNDLLLLTLSPNEKISHPDTLCGDILRECAAQRLRGAVIDAPPHTTGDIVSFLNLLAPSFRAKQYPLFVPEALAARVPGVTALICSAMSGGIFRERLKEAASQYGSIALDLQRSIMDFSVPSPSGEGKALSLKEFDAIRQTHRSSTFFSPELCARYFTYRTGGTIHFLLFDDAATLVEKIKVGKTFGISSFFLSYPEIHDILPEIEKTINKENPL